MAVVNITLHTAQTRALTGATLPVAASVPVATPEDITPTSTAQRSTTAVPDGLTAYVWRIVAIGAPVRIKFGAAATAAATGDILIPDGAAEWFGSSVSGEKVSVILATT